MCMYFIFGSLELGVSMYFPFQYAKFQTVLLVFIKKSKLKESIETYKTFFTISFHFRVNLDLKFVIDKKYVAKSTNSQ